MQAYQSAKNDGRRESNEQRGLFIVAGASTKLFAMAFQIKGRFKTET